MVSTETEYPVNDQKPKYKWLKEHLLKDFAVCRYESDKPIPSENLLAKTSGFARSTVRQALAELERDGVIRKIRGKGTFINNEREKKALTQTRIFALIIPEIDRGDLYPLLIKGFEEAAAENHFQVMVCNTNLNVYKQGNFILHVIDQNIAGVALVTTGFFPTPPSHVRQLQSNHIPVVLCHRAVPETTAPCLSLPQEEVGRIAAQALLERGHRRIAYFSTRKYSLVESYERGLRDVLEQHGQTLPDSHIYYGTLPTDPDRVSSAKEALAGMVNGADRPTAIFCSDDMEAEMIYLLLGDLKLKVPDDVSLIGFGSTHRTSPLRSKLTSVTVNEYEIGKQAARLLFSIRSGQEPLKEAKEIWVTANLTLGDTLRTI
jgi:GntR family transcriptional regulator, arabinose operon transcriptional repressor